MVPRSILLRLSPREAEKKHKVQHCELIEQEKKKRRNVEYFLGKNANTVTEYKRANENKTALVVLNTGVNARLD